MPVYKKTRVRGVRIPADDSACDSFLFTRIIRAEDLVKFVVGSAREVPRKLPLTPAHCQYGVDFVGQINNVIMV
jgi:hypothetical protein